MNAKRLLVVLSTATLIACGGDRPPAEDGASTVAVPREIRFTATDFAFEGPRTVEAGLVTVVLDNQVETWHHVQLIRLPEGMTVEEFGAGMAQMQPHSPPPPWLEAAGGVNPPPPGELARTIMHLEPGEYAVVCFVDTPDRVPHVAKGMIQPLTVTPASTAAADLPTTDLSLTLVDYAFSFSAPPTSGTHTIRVENGATQWHEIALFRFEPGKTMDDLMAWAETYEGPAPVVAAGGVPAIAPGQAVNIEVTLTPGDYVALCFLPDTGDGQLHMVHGMVLPFAVS
jgi:hypothetical protein